MRISDPNLRYIIASSYLNNQTDEQWDKLVSAVCPLPHDDRTFARYQGFYEYLTEGPDGGRTHPTDQGWNDAYDEGRQEAETIVGSRTTLLKQLEAQYNWFVACHLPYLSEQQARIWEEEVGRPCRAAIAQAKGQTP